MKNLSPLFVIAILLIGVFFAQPMVAQTAETPNVRKELKSVLKQMPDEMQLEVLRYAERKRDAFVAMEAKKAEAAARAEEARQQAATEQPQAAPQPAQAIEVKPQSGVAATPRPAAPATPVQPAYIQQANKLEPTTVEWYETQFDFGNIVQGETATHTYRFKNTGTEPLHLTRVKPSCGCTTPSYSKEPVAPGEEGFITVNFNTTGKSGIQSKAVTVTGNFEGTNQILRFRGEVKRPATPANGAGGNR